MDVKIIEIKVPEYTIDEKPNYLKIGGVVDDEIEKNFNDGEYIYRSIGKDDHPNLTLDELVSKILELGTDKYDPSRAEICAEDFKMFDHDIHAGSFKIKNSKIVLNKSYTLPTLFGDTIRDFYEKTLLDRGYPVRIDILIIYDANKLERAEKIDPNAPDGRPETTNCLYKFKDKENKRDALVGIIKIMR